MRFGFALTTSALFIALGACSQGSGTAKNADQIVQPLADDVVILEFNGGKVTAKDVKAQVEPQMKQMSEEVIDAYKKTAERMVIVKILEAEAKKQGVANPDELLGRLAQDVQVTDEQVDAFMKENNLQKGIKDPKTGTTRKVSKDEVRGFLIEQETQNKQQAYFAGLRETAKIKFKLDKPRTTIAMSGKEPFKGGANAKVVIHEFSDFQCPFCSRGKAVVDQIATEYGDKVKIVFRHMPLNFHPEAKPAAMASMCANKEGKFWEMHDALFDNQKELGAAKYKEWAAKIGLNAEAFAKCYDSQEMAAAVDADMKVAEDLGVNSTPTFFVNGQKVAGALPFSQFKSMIDEELAN